jgi:ribonuclease P protein component
VVGYVWQPEASKSNAVKGLGFSRPKHLVRTDEISSVFSLNLRFSSPHFQVLAKPGAQQFSRLAVIVSKKTARLATSRNYLKRMAREVFRMQQHELHGLDIVVRVRKSFTQADYPQTAPELRALLGRAEEYFATSRSAVPS